MYEEQLIDVNDIRERLWEEACEWARQRAREKGDVNLDRDEELIWKWQEEYYIDLCNNEGIDP